MEETREPLKNPVTAAVWRGLPDVAKEAIGMIVEAAGAGHLEMYNGIIAIAVRQCHAVTINPAAELRPGHEIMRGQGGPAPRRAARPRLCRWRGARPARPRARGRPARQDVRQPPCAPQGGRPGALGRLALVWGGTLGGARDPRATGGMTPGRDEERRKGPGDVECREPRS